MNTPASGLFDGQRGLAQPYPGGRAQAESGSKIIENDYYAWKAVCLRPYRLRADHPVLREFTYAWQAVSTLGLGDDAGAASIRYRVLGHTARSLVQAAAAGRRRLCCACGGMHPSTGIGCMRLASTSFSVPAHPARYADFARGPPDRRTSRSVIRH